MKWFVELKLNAVQILFSIAAGIILFLLPQDASRMIHASLRIPYVVFICIVVTVFLLIIFKSYKMISVSLFVAMNLIILRYIFSVISMLIENISSGAPFSMSISYYDGLCWGLIWFIPFLICTSARLFSASYWYTSSKRNQFNVFFNISAKTFFVYYIILLFACFILARPIDLFGQRQYNIIPFLTMLNMFSDTKSMIMHFTGNLFFFMPFGFYLSIYRQDMSLGKKILISLIVSVTIELLQLALNTGKADINDIILNQVGFFFGCMTKLVMDKLRASITGQEELSIFDGIDIRQ